MHINKLSNVLIKISGIIWIWISFILQIMQTNCQSLTLYKQTGTVVQMKDLITDNCTEVPPAFVQHIACGNFTTDCARFYDSERCSGNSVEIRKDSVLSLPWPLERVKSIGSCDLFAMCSDTNSTQIKGSDRSTSPGHTEGLLGSATVVELFEDFDFRGRMTTLTLKPGVCSLLPRIIKGRLSSLRFQADDCLELYRKSDCSGELVRIRTIGRNNPEAINLSEWGFDDKTMSITLCGFCGRNGTTIDSDSNGTLSITTITSKSQFPSSLCPHITLYDEADFSGNSKDIVVKADCVNITDEWEGAAESVELFQDCVIVYNHFGCEDYAHNNNSQVRVLSMHKEKLERVGKSRGRNRTVFRYNLQPLGMDGQVRSVGPCEEFMPSKSPFIAICMAVGMLVIGLLVAAFVNSFVKKRELREKEGRIYDLH